MEDGMTSIAEVSMECAAGYAQAIQVGAHHLTADEPKSNGGTDTGPGPYALLLSALGACTAITLRMYADRKGWALGEIHVRLSMLKARDGRERIERVITFGAPLSDDQRARSVGGPQGGDRRCWPWRLRWLATGTVGSRRRPPPTQACRPRRPPRGPRTATR